MSEEDLNNLVNNNGINSPSDTLYLVKMVSEHNIRSESEVIRHFNNHRDEYCDVCNQKNTGGSFEDRVDIMYEAQMKEFDEYKYSWNECYDYLYELFTNRTINGQSYEEKSINMLDNRTVYDIEEATGTDDVDKAVDVIVNGLEKDVLAGIQVKPKSYEKSNYTTAKMINKSKNNKADYPVIYLYYNDNGFTNIVDVCSKLDELSVI